MSGISEIDEDTAAGLLLQAYAAAQDKSAYKTSWFRKKPICDMVMQRIHLPSDQFAAFTFWAVKRNSAQSAAQALGGYLLLDVVKRLVNHAAGETSAVFGMASNVTSAVNVVTGKAIDVSEINKGATKLGGKMQLHAAKKMGKSAYDTTRTWGLIAERYHGGVVRFEKATGEKPGVNIVMRAWSGGSAASFIDRFQGRTSLGSGASEIERLHEWGGELKGHYFFDASNGELTKLSG